MNKEKLFVDFFGGHLTLHFSLYVLIAYWEKRERGVVFSRPLRALRAA